MSLFGAAAASSGASGGGSAPVFGLRWDGVQFVNGGSIVVSGGGLVADLQSASSSQLTSMRSLLSNVVGKFKFIFRLDYTTVPYSLYTGMCTAALNITNFANQSGNVEAIYNYLSALESAYSAGSVSLGELPLAGPLIVGISGDTTTGAWEYRDSQGGSYSGLGSSAGSAPGPLGVFCYVQGGPVTFTILQDDGGLVGLPSDAVNVSN